MSNNLPLFRSDHPVRVESTYHPEAELVLYPGDVRDLLAQVPDNTIRLIVTSPPYNLGKEYETCGSRMSPPPSWSPRAEKNPVLSALTPSPSPSGRGGEKGWSTPCSPFGEY